MSRHANTKTFLRVTIISVFILVLALTLACTSKGPEPKPTSADTTTQPVTITTPAVQYSIDTTVSPQNGGTISFSAGGPYTAGAQVEASAVPATGYRFDHWAGDASGRSSRVNLTMDGAKILTAFFQQQFTLKASVEPAQGGTVSSSGGQYDAGTSVTFTATPTQGFRFDKWSGAGDIEGPELKLTADSSREVVATFVRQYKVTVTVDPAGSGTASPSSGSFDAGSKIYLSAYPGMGYKLESWEGITAEAVTNSSFFIDSDKSIIVHFFKNKLDMNEAQSKGLIKVQFQGTGFLNWANMKVTSNSDKPYICTLPVGTVLKPSENNVQRMVVTVPLDYPLETIKKGSSNTTKISVVTIDMGKDVANTTQTLNLSTEALTGDLKTMIEYPMFMYKYASVSQYAAWTIRENPPDQYGYWPINNSYPDKDKIKLIRDLFKEAGIDASKYRVFKNVLGNE